MSYIIINFRPFDTYLSSSEYIKKTKFNLDIHKSHGLGSGIYGLIPTQSNYITQATQRKYEIKTKLTLNNPYEINTNKQLSRFIELSIWLILQCEEIINKNLIINNIKNKVRNIKIPDIIKEITIELFNNMIDINLLLNSIFHFVKDYQQAKIGDFIKQPINYLLEPYYDGIYNHCSYGNLFSVGSIKFRDINIRHQKGNFDKEGFFLSNQNKLINI